MLDIADSMGLICGYKLESTGETKVLEWEDMDSALADGGAAVWLHFNLIDVRARKWIQQCSHLPEEAREFLLVADNHMRIISVEPGYVAVLGDLCHEFVDNAERLDVMRLYVDHHCLITARRQPLASVDKLRKAIGKGLKVQRPIRLVIHFLHYVTDTLSDLIMQLHHDVEDIEEQILVGKTDGVGGELGRIRRTAAQLRRRLVPQQNALLGFSTRLPNWIVEDDAYDLRAAVDRLGALSHDLELIQEQARLLHEQASARMIEATNRNLYILSIVTTIFMPMTLISGIFGMNLGGMPGVNHDVGFWYGIAVMIATGLLTVIILRRWKML